MVEVHGCTAIRRPRNFGVGGPVAGKASGDHCLTALMEIGADCQARGTSLVSDACNIDGGGCCPAYQVVAEVGARGFALPGKVNVPS